MEQDQVGFGFVLRGSAPCYVHTIDPWGPAAAAGLQVWLFASYTSITCTLNTQAFSGKYREGREFPCDRIYHFLSVCVCKKLKSVCVCFIALIPDVTFLMAMIRATDLFHACSQARTLREKVFYFQG